MRHRGAGLFGVLLLFLAGVVRAQPTCNGLASIDYTAGPNFSLPGDVRRVRLELGTGSINGGTHLIASSLRFDLDCNSNFPLTSPCTDEGAFVEYEGDGTITTTCGVIFTTGHAVGPFPNSIVFTPAVPISVPPNQPVPPGFCSLEFDVKVLAAPSVDVTPDMIEEVGGYTASDFCDNAVAVSGGTQSVGSLPICPSCSGAPECTTASCNQTTGQCDTNNLPDGTLCGDTDLNACTSAGCEQGQCVQTDHAVSCPPGGDCTQNTCNPQTGMCESGNAPDGSTCPDTDQDPCTTPGCVQGQCVQTYQSCPPPQPITAKKLLLKSSKFVLLSKDPSISISGSDPVNGADSSITFNDGGTPVDLALPAALWSANGAGTTFKYKNPDAPGGPSVVKIAKVKDGLLKVVGKGAPIAVPNGPASIDVVFRLDGGTNAYCMSFTGTGDGEKFLVKDAAAGACPSPVCGDNVREDPEACDGSDDAACPNDCLSDCTCAALCPVSAGDSTACQNAGSLPQCDACCTADANCLYQCSAAVAFSCTINVDGCAAAVNAAGCAAECCP